MPTRMPPRRRMPSVEPTRKEVQFTKYRTCLVELGVARRRRYSPFFFVSAVL